MKRVCSQHFRIMENNKANQNPFKRYWEWRNNKKEAERIAYEKMNFKEKVISWVKTLGGAIVVVTILNGILIASFVVPTGSMENTVMTGEFLFVNKFKYGPSTPQIIPILNIPLPFYKTPPIWSPKQGDVIVFIYPGDREEVKHEEFMYYLKRCVAVSGDTLKIVNDSVYVNGVQFHLPPGGKYIDNPTYHDESYTFPVGKNFTRSNYGPIRIPKMGDVITLTNDNFNEWNIFIQREGHKVERNGDDFMIDGVKTNSYIVNRDYVFGMGDNRNNSLDSRYWGFIPKQDVVGTPMMVYWSWETEDRNGRPLSMFKKLSKIRWSRLGSIIN